MSPNCAEKVRVSAEAEKIVGLIGKTNERAGQSADAACRPMDCLPFSLSFRVRSQCLFLIAFDLDGLVFLYSVEVNRAGSNGGY